MNVVFTWVDWKPKWLGVCGEVRKSIPANRPEAMESLQWECWLLLRVWRVAIHLNTKRAGWNKLKTKPVAALASQVKAIMCKRDVPYTNLCPTKG